MIFLRAFTMDEANSDCFALPVKGGLRIQKDKMSLYRANVLSNDEDLALLSYLTNDFKFPLLGINLFLFDDNGLEGDRWAEDNWNGRYVPSDIYKKNIEGLVLTGLVSGLIWQFSNPGKQTAAEFIEAGWQIPMPFVTRTDGMFFSVTKNGCKSSMEEMAYHMLDEVTHMMQRKGLF